MFIYGSQNSLPRMPVLVLTADQQMAAMEKGSSELKYQLAKEGVTVDTQAKLFHVGAVSLSRFAAFFKDAEELRLVSKDELGVDPADGLTSRAELAGLIISWEAASARTKEIAKHFGELDARKQSKPLLGSDYLMMKYAFEQKYYKLDDIDCPARVYLEKRVAEMESGEMRAEMLKTVLNREQDNEENLVPHWDSTGAMSLKRTINNIEDPGNPEELRRRINIMVNGLVFIAMQHTNRQELQSIRPDMANTYASYLLGEHVWMLIAKDEEGHTIASPHWKLVIQYEYAIRKRAYAWMNEEGVPFNEALKRACLDPLTKDRNFTTPLAISAATGSKKVEIGYGTKRSATDLDKPKYEENSSSKGGGKGKGKGKNKGKKLKGGGGGKGGGNLTVPSGCARATPDGRAICYGYNDFGVRCRNPKCSFLHVCGICFQKHPLYACQGKGKFASESPKPETQGSGGKP